MRSRSSFNRVTLQAHTIAVPRAAVAMGTPPSLLLIPESAGSGFAPGFTPGIKEGTAPPSNCETVPSRAHKNAPDPEISLQPGAQTPTGLASLLDHNL
jgi:hypothetical protein